MINISSLIKAREICFDKSNIIPPMIVLKLAFFYIGYKIELLMGQKKIIYLRPFEFGNYIIQNRIVDDDKL